jgi:hypothetical protein
MSDSPRKPFGHAKPSAPIPKPARPAPPKPAFEVVEDEPDSGFEVVDEAPPPPKKAVRIESAPKKAVRVEAEPEAKPKSAKRAVPVAPEPPQDEPEKKPRKKAKPKPDALSKRLLKEHDEDEARRADSLKHFEFTVPIVVLIIGIVLSIVGGLGAAKGVSGIFVFVALCIFVAIYVPLCCGALMVVGVLLGINYGRLVPAILKLSAITFIANGLTLIGESMKLPGFLVFPICCFISFGMFMTMFDLDTWEANASAGALNVMNFLANMVLLIFIVVGDAATGGGGSGDTDDEPRQERRRDRDKKPVNPDVPPGPAMPDNDDE